MASGVYGQTLLDALDATGLAIDLTDDTNNKLHLVDEAATIDFDDTTPYFTGAQSEFSNRETAVSSQALDNQSWSISGGTATWDSDDEVFASVTATARYSVIFDDGETNDNMIILHDFGQEYNSTSGNFTVSWNTYIMSVDYTP